MFDVFGFYKFKKLKALKKNKAILQNIFIKYNIRGTLIISKEGLNGTISGKSKDIYFVNKKIKSLFTIKILDNEILSKSLFQPFHKGKIKIKNEVVPMGLNTFIKIKKNNYIEPLKWNKLIKDKNTLVLDARKPFEFNVGTFKNSTNPSVDNFREFPKYLKKLSKNKSIAMFCTGGIRCEKASMYLQKRGFNNIFQLKGGVLNYLKKVKQKDSLWRGECFVFDNRISVKHNLEVGSYSMCSGCRKPVSPKDKKSSKYEEGVSCPECYNKLSEVQKKRFRMRQKQINLAKKAGKRHIFQKDY
ncbi:MAG: UPF0176 protein [Pelagibacterales bacterium]|nr:UPF0176 protein [Pelagibacterales bacterium]